MNIDVMTAPVKQYIIIKAMVIMLSLFLNHTQILLFLFFTGKKLLILVLLGFWVGNISVQYDWLSLFADNKTNHSM